jgi:hypothetical protein
MNSKVIILFRASMRRRAEQFMVSGSMFPIGHVSFSMSSGHHTYTGAFMARFLSGTTWLPAHDTLVHDGLLYSASLDKHHQISEQERLDRFDTHVKYQNSWTWRLFPSTGEYHELISPITFTDREEAKKTLFDAIHSSLVEDPLTEEETSVSQFFEELQIRRSLLP